MNKRKKVYIIKKRLDMERIFELFLIFGISCVLLAISNFLYIDRVYGEVLMFMPFVSTNGWISLAILLMYLLIKYGIHVKKPIRSSKMTFQGLAFGIPKEILAGERRVAATPKIVKKIISEAGKVIVQTGAGQGSFFTDDEYKAAGAELVADAEQLFAMSDRNSSMTSCSSIFHHQDIRNYLRIIQHQDLEYRPPVMYHYTQLL